MRRRIKIECGSGERDRRDFGCESFEQLASAVVPVQCAQFSEKTAIENCRCSERSRIAGGNDAGSAGAITGDQPTQHRRRHRWLIAKAEQYRIRARLERIQSAQARRDRSPEACGPA